MDKIIVGIEKNIPYDYQGRKGVTNRIYVIDSEETMFSRQNGSDFIGRHAEFVKVPKSIDIEQFSPDDVVRILYNRYGQPEEIQKVASHGTK